MTDRNRLVELIEAREALLQSWGDGTIVTEAAGPLYPWAFPAILAGLALLLVGMLCLPERSILDRPGYEGPGIGDVTKKRHKHAMLKAGPVMLAGVLVTVLGFVVANTTGPTTVDRDRSQLIQQTKPLYDLLEDRIAAYPEVMRADIELAGATLPLLEVRDKKASRLVGLPEQNSELSEWTVKLTGDQRPLVKITYNSGEQAVLEAAFNSEDKFVLVEPLV